MNKTLNAYQPFIDRVRSLCDDDKLEEVNRFFDNLLFVADIDHFDQLDYWQTPTQMLECGAGDCEDFALGKYFTLVDAGMDRSKLRLGHMQARGTGLQNAAHMVLLYYPVGGADPLVLDNLVEEIMPLSERVDLTLVYSFNHDGVWTKDPLKKVRDNNLPMWVELLSRIG